MRFVRLTTIGNSYEANFLKDDLDDAGIACFLTNENLTNLFPTTIGLDSWGIQVMVPEDALEKAKEVLRNRDRWTAAVRCPNCGSTRVRLVSVSPGWFRNLFGLLFVGPAIADLRSGYECSECVTSFKR
jgi:hypothetical protein